jgi:hypothetical protein
MAFSVRGDHQRTERSAAVGHILNGEVDGLAQEILDIGG